MDLGVAPPTFATDGWRLPASRLTGFARTAERHGFAGVWVTEHLRQPPDRSYSRLSPFTTLAVFAGATERIPLGTAILILPLRNPVLAAERAATLQHLSEERLTLGLGLGWVEAEYAAVGIPFEDRGRRFTEGLNLLRQLLHEDTVTFDGEFYHVENFRLEPTVQRPPRILVGGGGVERDGERTVPTGVKDRIARFADGWLAPPRPPRTVAEDWDEIAAAISANGGDPSLLDRVVLNWLHLVPGVDSETALSKQRRVYRRERSASPDRADSALSNQLTGSVDDVRATIDAYAELGFDQLILGPTTHDPDAANRQLEHWSEYLR